MTESRSVAPLSARRKMMEEPTLGAGSFLDHALALNPNREEPFVYKHFTDQRGNVVLKGHSLVDLAAIRDQYARWYWANGVRPGEPVGVLVAEGIEPLFHYLALTSLGAVPAMVNDAMPPASAKRYLDHVGVVGLVCDDPTALVAGVPRERPAPAPLHRARFGAPRPRPLERRAARRVSVPARGRRSGGADSFVGHDRHTEVDHARSPAVLGRQAGAHAALPGRTVRSAAVADAAHACRWPELLHDRGAARPPDRDDGRLAARGGRAGHEGVQADDGRVVPAHLRRARDRRAADRGGREHPHLVQHRRRRPLRAHPAPGHARPTARRVW